MDVNAKAQGFNPGTYATGTSVYGYVANGNLTSDPYKGASTGMTVTYNHLNLPTAMSFGSNGSISILYDRTGKKLRKAAAPTSGGGYTQDYVDGLEYRTNSGGGTLTLEAIYHAEGRITPAGAAYQYEYNIKDHLGNTRLTFADLNANGVVDVPSDILQENHYYPFGLKMNYTWIDNVALDNKYQYNGIERNEDLGLNLDLAVFRGYDAAVGRWWQVDPKPDFTSSPYSFVTNNPFRYGDQLGDTLRAVNELSAQRAQAIISNTFKGMGIKGSPAASLFKIGKDGKTFNQISAKDFKAATKGLDRDGRALARGYMKAINSKETNTLEIVKRSEPVSSLGDKYKTGADVDRNDYGGRTVPSKFDGKLVRGGGDGGSHVVVVMDATSNTQYSDGVSLPSLAGELLAHELIGHGLGGREMQTDGKDEAVQASNLFLRSNGIPYYRTDHSFLPNNPNTDPRGIPAFLEDDPFGN